MDERVFRSRTKNVGLQAIRLVNLLPRQSCAALLGRQLVRSATSIGANYRAACRGKSRADMLSKFAIVEEEADETLYWLELLVESGTVTPERLQPLVDDVNEILAMIVASIKTLRVSNPKSKI
jgi:four helix bundle protein